MSRKAVPSDSAGVAPPPASRRRVGALLQHRRFQLVVVLVAGLLIGGGATAALTLDRNEGGGIQRHEISRQQDGGQPLQPHRSGLPGSDQGRGGGHR